MSKQNGFSFAGKTVEKGWFGKLMKDAREQSTKAPKKANRKKKQVRGPR